MIDNIGHEDPCSKEGRLSFKLAYDSKEEYDLMCGKSHEEPRSSEGRLSYKLPEQVSQQGLELLNNPMQNSDGRFNE